MRFSLFVAIFELLNSAEGRLLSQNAKRQLNATNDWISPYSEYLNEDQINTYSHSSSLDDEADDEAGRIIGGTVARNGRYDYVAQAQGSKACGGMLIASNIVLSAGHCHGGFNKVLLGFYNYNTYGADKRKEIITVRKEIRHPSYNGGNYYSDFLILVLDEDSRFDPVCLPNQNEQIAVGRMLNVIGFGLTKPNGSLSNIMREARVKYISNAACDKKYTNHGIYDNMMCCDSANVGRDACQGDSGGPLIKLGQTAAQDVLVGVVSWGVGCADLPGVYSRVTEVLPWIRNIARQYGGRFRSNCPSGSNTSNNGNASRKCPVKDTANFKTASGVTCGKLRANRKLAANACRSVNLQAKCPIACACHAQRGRITDEENFSDIELDDDGNGDENLEIELIDNADENSEIETIDDNFEIELVDGSFEEEDGNDRLLTDERTCTPRDNNSYRFPNSNRRCANWVTKAAKARCRSPLARAKCPVTCSCFA